MLVRPACGADAGAASCRAVRERLACQHDRALSRTIHRGHRAIRMLVKICAHTEEPRGRHRQSTSSRGRRDAERRPRPATLPPSDPASERSPRPPPAIRPPSDLAPERPGALAPRPRLRAAPAPSPRDRASERPRRPRAAARRGPRSGPARACSPFYSVERRHLVDMSVRACSYCVARASGPTSALAREATRCSR